MLKKLLSKRKTEKENATQNPFQDFKKKEKKKRWKDGEEEGGGLI